MLPTFLILGAARSGTTALRAYLGQHPDVFVPRVDEPNFFAYGETPVQFVGPGDTERVRTSMALDDYEALFADARSSQARGEASPSSLYHPRAPKRIEQYVPDAHLIVSLRNPVERAFSNYLFFVRDGREPCDSFREALDREDQRVQDGWEHGWHYTRLGHYHDQLRRYYERFDPNQIHVHLFGEFVNNPTPVVQNLYQVLGVDNAFTPDTSVQYNPSGRPRSATLHWLLQEAGLGAWTRSLLPTDVARTLRSWTRPITRPLKQRLTHANMERPSMSDDVRRRLRDLYRDDILRLENLIDRDLSHWLTFSSSSS